RRALREVDRDRVALTGRGERRRLAGLHDELEQMGAGDLSQVEPREDRVAELEQPQAEPVATGRGHVLDDAGAGQRREQARDGARVDPGTARDLVRTELWRAVRERVEDGERALDGGDVANGRVSW